MQKEKKWCIFRVGQRIPVLKSGCVIEWRWKYTFYRAYNLSELINFLQEKNNVYFNYYDEIKRVFRKPVLIDDCDIIEVY